MSIIDIILLAIALAMDCLTVSIVSGLTARDGQATETRWLYRMAFLFGFFQAFMPLLGWLGIIHFETYMEAYDHWIAFGLLAFVGARWYGRALVTTKNSTSTLACYVPSCCWP